MKHPGMHAAPSVNPKEITGEAEGPPATLPASYSVFMH